MIAGLAFPVVLGRGHADGGAGYAYAACARPLLACRDQASVAVVEECTANGAGTVDPVDGQGPQALAPGAAFRERWASRHAEGRNFVVLTAVNAEQLSGATQIDGVRENPFTYAVRTAFAGEADGFGANGGTAGTKDGRITLDELVGYIPHAAREKSGQPGDPASRFDPQVAASFEAGFVITPLGDRGTTGQPGTLYLPAAMKR